MVIELSVTQSNIHKGIKKHSEKCAVALALLELYPDAIDLSISDCEIYLVKVDNLQWKAKPDKDLKLFINSFDNGYSVKPSTFSLDFSLM